jgi:hypothetical protein
VRTTRRHLGDSQNFPHAPQSGASSTHAEVASSLYESKWMANSSAQILDSIMPLFCRDLLQPSAADRFRFPMGLEKIVSTDVNYGSQPDPGRDLNASSVSFLFEGRGIRGQTRPTRPAQRTT